MITDALRITRDGAPAQKLDIEGVALDGEGGFWLASEGNPEREKDPTQIVRECEGPDGAVVEEIAALGLATEGGYSAGAVAPPRASTPPALTGFRIVAIERRPTYTLVLYRAERPTFVPLSRLTGLALADEQPGVLLQKPYAARTVGTTGGGRRRRR